MYLYDHVNGYELRWWIDWSLFPEVLVDEFSNLFKGDLGWWS